MTHNVGPYHVQFSAFPQECGECKDVMFATWDGANGVWQCSTCLENIEIDYDESGGVHIRGNAGDDNAF